jgi:hypothetical protein
MFQNIQTTLIGLFLLGLIAYCIYANVSENTTVALIGALTGIGFIFSKDANK